MLTRALRAATIVVVALALLTWAAPRADPRTLLSTPSSSPTAAEVTGADTLLPAAVNSPTPTPTPLPALEAMRITIPRLGIDLPLARGDATRDVPRAGYAGSTPEDIAFVFPGTAALGAGGNTYIYAHARVGMFLALWDAQVDDEVIVYAPERPDLKLRYVVTQIAPRVTPTDTSWLDPAGPERLTLQTSTGPYPSDPRFIVVARRDAGRSATP